MCVALLHYCSQGHLYIPVRPRPANKLCPPKFLDQYMYKFSFEKPKKKKKNM